MKYHMWIERDFDNDNPIAIRVDWDNDRHQRIPINGGTAKELSQALLEMSSHLVLEIRKGEIN